MPSLAVAVQDDTSIGEDNNPRGSTCRASHSASEKPEKPLLVELKNGRLVFKQKTLSFEKMSDTMQGASQSDTSRDPFVAHSSIWPDRDRQVPRDAGGKARREGITPHRRTRRTQTRNCETRPREVRAFRILPTSRPSSSFSRSDKTLSALSKHIQQELLPTMDEDEEEYRTPTILPLEVVEHAVKSVAKRVNYGLDSPLEGGKVPASWLIWRWEVSDLGRDWLPKNAREKVDNRWRERQQVRQTIFP